jgi:uncharacterized phiE125 gp8 family phage protein
MSYPIDSGFLNDKYGSQRLSGYVKTDPQGEELKRTVKNQYQLVTLGDVKTYLNVTHDRHDEMLTSMITSAQDMCERYAGLAFLTSTYEVYYRWVYDFVYLPLNNQSVTSVKKIDLDGNETTLSSSEYVVLGNTQKVLRLKTPINNQLQVTFTAGIESAPKDLDKSILDAIKSQVKFLYARDFATDLQVEASLKTGLNVESEMLLRPYREWNF